MKSKIKLVAIALMGLFLVSCAATQSRDGSFLSSYSGLKKKSSLKGTVIYKGDLEGLKGYDKIFLEEVRVYTPTEMEKKEITSADLLRVRNSLRAALHKSVQGTRFALVGESGPQTLSLRAAITDLYPGDPKVFATGYVPYVGMVGTVAGAARGRRPGAGSATVEAELVDSVTRERFFAGIDQNAGSKLQVKAGMTRWGHIDAALGEWSEQFHEFLKNPAE